MIQTDSGKGHDWSAARFDALGISYVFIAFVYSCILLYGLYRLYLLRHTPAVRLRSFRIICFTVLTLHCYLVAVLLVYPLNGFFKCGEEFWIMSIFLPFSIALFQASNIRVLSYYEEQQRFAGSKASLRSRSEMRPSIQSIVAWFGCMSVAQRTCVGVAIGGICQVAVTIVLFFGSRRFHASYGFFSNHVDAGHCRRGPEWIPSVFWQFLWTTVFGPYVLLRIRNIFDSHCWAWQTRFAIIACLPGTPLWLAFLYSKNPKLVEVNRWFVPAGWFLPGLATMQLVSIFIPLHNAIKMNHLQKRLSVALDESRGPVTVTNRRRSYSLASLDYQIEHNIEPLLRWSAQKEFTAENILFLREVRDFKRKWSLRKRCGALTPTQLHERYEEAAVIYFTLVNSLTAKFNINIDHKTYMNIEVLFRNLKYEPFVNDSDMASCNSKPTSDKSDNIIAPWIDPETDDDGDMIRKASDEVLYDRNLNKLYPLPVTEIRSSEEFTSGKLDGSVANSGHEPFDTNIPAAFTIDCFDRAYDIVRYDVYVNTWSRYEARFPRPQRFKGDGVDLGGFERKGSKVDISQLLKRGSRALGV